MTKSSALCFLMAVANAFSTTILSGRFSVLLGVFSTATLGGCAVLLAAAGGASLAVVGVLAVCSLAVGASDDPATVVSVGVTEEAAAIVTLLTLGLATIVSAAVTEEAAAVDDFLPPFHL